MKLRKYISLVLLAVYLFAAGGAAYAALTCHCKAAPVVQHTEACCHVCDHTGDLPAATADFTAPCCGDSHSTYIDLYTGSASESHKNVKCTVLTLPPALAAECPCPYHVPSLRVERVERFVPLADPACVLPSGLRAPPVLA